MSSPSIHLFDIETELLKQWVYSNAIIGGSSVHFITRL